MKWFIHHPDNIGCTYYRSILPIRHLEEELEKHGVTLTFSDTFDDSFDVYSFARWLDPRYIPLIFELKHKGKIITWDLDDDLLDINRFDDKDSDVEGHIWALKLYLSTADVITVSTPYLKTVVNHPKKTVVLPNLIDLDDYPIQLRSERNVILYTGSPSHRRDIFLIRELYETTKEEYDWVFYGINPEWIDLYATYIPWSSVNDYPRVCRLINPRFCLAPLEACEFNKSKSPIKIWECATLGANVIASDFGPYKGFKAAIVSEDEYFTTEHLIDNYDQVVQDAIDWSWQHSVGREAWFNFFTSIRKRK